LYSPQAEAHLLALFSQIAVAASPEIAARYTDAIVEQCESLVTFPMRGAQRDDLHPGLRVFGFRRRVSIAFLVESDSVIIAGIFYGGQNLESIFEE
jgi:plasmid stabilization system protein ParE